MSKSTVMVITEVLIDEQPTLNLEELCSACNVTPEFIEELIEYGVLEMSGQEFNAGHMQRVMRVVRLQQDLEVNLPGAAVILDLMDEVEEMRQQLEVYEKHWLL